MDVLTAIRTRRSIRKFSDKPVNPAHLIDIVNSASFSPSAGDARPWSFVILDRDAVLKELIRINPYATAALTAPSGIVVCGEPQLEKHPGFWVQDCAACTQTLMLAAHAGGIGTCWTGIYPLLDRVAAYRRILAMPKSSIPFALILAGYPARDETANSSRDAVDKVHYNIYGHRDLPD